jgi:hypothetical protein
LGCLLAVHVMPTLAIDNQTVPMLSMRVQKALSANSYVNFALNARFNEGFEEHEREIAEVRVGRRNGSNDVSAAYNLHFDRNGQSGSEHRLWQQLRHEFSLPGSSFESSLRIEERYFTDTDKAGARLRVLNRWNKPLTGANELRLGYEWVFNLDDMSAAIQRGTSQDRLLAGVRHELPGGKRIEFQYQLRYLHLPAQDNRLQHQLQLTYAWNL